MPSVFYILPYLTVPAEVVTVVPQRAKAVVAYPSATNGAMVEVKLRL
jgi:hypothetical protein